MARSLGLVLAWLISLPVLTSAAPTLTLPQAERLALRNNLLLQAGNRQLQARTATLQGSRGLYDLTLTSTLEAGREQFPFNDGNLRSVNDLTLENRGLDERYLEGSVGLSRRFSTGATLNATLGDNRTDDTRFIQPEYRGDLSLKLTQPLLRDFGALATEREILRADKNRGLALEERERTAARVILDVRTRWYEVLRLQQDLQLRQASIDLARQLVEENQARVEAGVLPEVEVLSARVGLQLRLTQQQETRRQLQDERDRLSLLLQAPLPDSLAEILPQPNTPILDPEAGLETAHRQRPELRRFQVAVEQADLELAIARNQERPDLDLVARYNHRSLDNALAGSLSDLSETDFHSWSVGLQFSYPLGNRQRLGETHAARFNLDRSRFLLRQAEEEVRREIARAARFLTTRLTQYDTVRLESRLAEERVDILLERQRVGLATVTDVLDGEEDLTDARTREFQALADIHVAYAAYLFATGELLADARPAPTDPDSQPAHPGHGA